MDLTTTVTVLLLVGLGVGAGLLVGLQLGSARERAAAAQPDPESARRSGETAVVKEGLERLGDQLRDLEHNRVSWQGQLHQQVLDVRHATDLLRRETQTLSTALRRPQVRGRWGELHLRRAVELAGLVDRCDFAEQVRLDDGALRPDLVVQLVGGRQVVVDAKVPLDAYLDANGTDDPDEHEAHLARHARQVRTHVDQLAAKGYWRSLDQTPEMVVLFVPAESFLAAALAADPGLLEHAAARQVVLASPTTLIALLRTVAHGWRQEALADQAREVHRLGRDLHHRLGTLSRHLDGLGRSLGGAVSAYNQTVASWESRVLVAARRFDDLGVTTDELPAPPAVGLRPVGEDRRGAHPQAEDGPSVRTAR